MKVRRGEVKRVTDWRRQRRRSPIRGERSRGEGEMLLCRPTAVASATPKSANFEQTSNDKSAELQRDIEQHSAGVSSVLALCDVLLRDGDACVGELENDSIQQTSSSLDRRWRNICAMSMERRMRIEETWRLWSKFLDDYARFEDWLRSAEVTAANPLSADVLYTIAKEELKKFEVNPTAFQRQVHERLTQLELVNKQYRRLARENRTDASSRLKAMVQEGNGRWDGLQRRVAAVLRRLKHFTSQREDFEGTREGILVWLTEMDLQLTNVEHFSQSDVEDKMRQLNVFQKEITLNTNKIDGLIVFGERLIQRSAPLDAVLLEDELEELHSYCQEVFGRVARFHQRLLNRRPVLEEERDLSDLEDSVDLGPRAPWVAAERLGAGGPGAMCHLLVPPLERSGRGTPGSVDSIPLEWDHTVDVGGSSSHEDDDEATFFSALSDVGVTRGSGESVLMATARAMVAASVKSGSEGPSWHQPSSPDRKPREAHRVRAASPPQTPTSHSQQGYVKLMSECSGNIDSVKRVKLILNNEEELEEAGLTCSTADKHTCTGVIERWELFQAQTISDKQDIQHDLEQWKKLNSDLSDVTSWLGLILPELERLQRLAPATSLQDIERNIWKLKDMQRTFNSYKCLVISVNLGSKHFQRGESPELRVFQDGLREANQGWSQACASLQAWETGMQGALMESQEFNETLHSLLLGLARVESHLQASGAWDARASRSALLGHRDSLTVRTRGPGPSEVEGELRGQQQQVTSLQEISSHLLLEVTEPDGLEAKEKVHVIANKLRLLLRRVGSELRALRGRLVGHMITTLQGSLGHKETGPTSSESDGADPLALQKEDVAMATGTCPTATRRTRGEKRDASPPRSFFHRVLRAAFPLHLLFLLLLLLVCLVPVAEEPYSCTLANNFARSFYPMLHYTNGPPPT
ncbi:Nesprin-2 [Merluccius polli]|uniref:Nesprin-2 n=1 Tax=Merluccius polli TaxID=89951 RepID=A0AA47MXR2_MERPO|nr:Nesprin-2 [Merluccius polli]